MKQKPVASEEKGTWRLGMQSIYSNCSIFNAFALGYLNLNFQFVNKMLMFDCSNLN